MNEFTSHIVKKIVFHGISNERSKSTLIYSSSTYPFMESLHLIDKV